MDLNVKYKPTKFVGKNIKANLQELELGKEFLDLTPKP